MRVSHSNVMMGRSTTGQGDKANYEGFIGQIGRDVFGEERYSESCTDPKYMVIFLHDEVCEEDQVWVEDAWKVYEDGSSFEKKSIRERSYMCSYTKLERGKSFQKDGS